MSETNPVRAYRLGALCRPEPWSAGGSEAEEILIELRPGTWIEVSGKGILYIHSHDQSVGLGVHTAEALGLCRVVPPGASGQEGRAAEREWRMLTQDVTAGTARRLSEAVAAAAEAEDPLAVSVSRVSPEATLEALAEHFEKQAR